MLALLCFCVASEFSVNKDLYNLYNIYFVFDLDGEYKFIKTKHFSD